jgi:acylphosphatase
MATRIIFSGSVQGVGFRWRAERCAKTLGLGGFVKNLPDGTVEAVVDGPEARIALFIEDLCKIHHVEEVKQEKIDGNFNGFRIKQ